MRGWLRRTRVRALGGKAMSGYACVHCGHPRVVSIHGPITRGLVPLVSHSYLKRQALTRQYRYSKDFDTSSIVIQVPVERWQSGRGRRQEVIPGTRL